MSMPKVSSIWLVVGPQTFRLANARSNGANAHFHRPFRPFAACFFGKYKHEKIFGFSSDFCSGSSVKAPAVAEGDVALGQKAFQRCSPVIRQRTRRIGSVVGRAAGCVEGVRYSAAMKAFGLVWDEATLDRFLAAPREVVPKTTMAISVPKPGDRQNIIAYLESLSQ
ncbi:cytochrome c2 [Rhizobium tibeticum]|nr:cytochrome c2 [Rhizobium tibeticum]